MQFIKGYSFAKPNILISSTNYVPKKCSRFEFRGSLGPLTLNIEHRTSNFPQATPTILIKVFIFFAIMIYHVTTQRNWDLAITQGYYSADSIALEGFIHCCKKDQLNGVIERYYQDVDQLFILEIEPSKVTSPLKYELAPSVNEEFPHIYGTLNLDAVVSIQDIIFSEIEAP